MIKIKIAGIPIAIHNRFDYFSDFARDYFTDEEPELVICPTDEDFLRERELIGDPNMPEEHLELTIIYRMIATHLYKYDAIIFHGAVIEHEGVAYAVTAHSGVGKTTHIRLWLREFGDSVRVLNGDKPILRLIDGKIYACGTPWRGKERYGVNCMRPLGGIGFLKRGEVNRAFRTTPSEVTVRFMNQIYLDKTNALSLAKNLRLANAVLTKVPIYELECNMDPEAAHVAYGAFVGGKDTI